MRILLASDESQGTRVRKETAWEKVHENFSIEEKVHVRSKEDLKLAFNNLVQRAKKKVGDEKVRAKGTGGGPARPPLSPTTELIVDMLPHTFQPLNT